MAHATLESIRKAIDTPSGRISYLEQGDGLDQELRRHWKPLP